MKQKLLISLVIILAMLLNQNLKGQMKSEDLNTIVGKARNKFNVPAIAVVITNADSILSAEIQGTRVAGTDNPVTYNDYFHIGSCSKSVLAVMAGRLIESGKINWNSKFFDVYPELINNANTEYMDITLEELFLCEAGIQPYTSGDEKFPEIDPSAENKRLEFIKYLIKQPPASKKNKDTRLPDGQEKRFQHLYSNASYTMVASMLEKVYGKKYEELVQETLRDNLGLSVHIGWPNSINSEQPWGHLIMGKEAQSFPPDHEYKLPYLITPAGDLSMKPLDYAKYTQLFLKGLRGENNYISSETCKYISFGHKGFSLGVANGNMNGYKYVGFDGSGGTFFCRSIVVPESNLAFTIMMNAGSGSGTMKAVDWITMKTVKKYYNWWWKFWM